MTTLQIKDNISAISHQQKHVTSHSSTSDSSIMIHAQSLFEISSLSCSVTSTPHTPLAFITINLQLGLPVMRKKKKKNLKKTFHPSQVNHVTLTPCKILKYIACFSSNKLRMRQIRTSTNQIKTYTLVSDSNTDRHVNAPHVRCHFVLYPETRHQGLSIHGL